jgi:putative SOS response-associated peptidase YedK
MFVRSQGHRHAQFKMPMPQGGHETLLMHATNLVSNIFVPGSHDKILGMTTRAVRQTLEDKTGSIYNCRMCNLYSMTRPRSEILRLFRVSDNRAGEITPQPSIFPAYNAPIIREAADGERELSMMSWGFVRPEPGKAPRRVTNVRDDTVQTSRFWKPSFEARRCLVPASSYCEPNGQKPATWYWFAVNGEDERELFAFPGIWQRWKGPIKKEGPSVELDVYAFMTTTPNALTDSINHERMPVLLTNETDFETWLSGSTTEAFALARSFDPNLMRIVQTGKDKEDLLGRPQVGRSSILL